MSTSASGSCDKTYACTSVGDLVLRTSRMLNDDIREDTGTGLGIRTEGDFVRWPRAVLIDFLNEGLAVLQSLRPDSFTQVRVFTLQPGAKQRLPEGMDTLLEVIANVNTDGSGGESIGKPIREQDNEFTNLLLSYNCAAATCVGDTAQADSVVSGYSMSSQDPKGFTVDPPVPVGSVAKVCARVVVEPPVFCATDTACCVGTPRKHDANLVDWMLHRAWLGDIESTFAAGASASALNRFYGAVDKARLTEARHGSGYWHGRIGEGDENATPRSS